MTFSILTDDPTNWAMDEGLSSSYLQCWCGLRLHGDVGARRLGSEIETET
jgi:hypothetical protein